MVIRLKIAFENGQWLEIQFYQDSSLQNFYNSQFWEKIPRIQERAEFSSNWNSVQKISMSQIHRVTHKANMTSLIIHLLQVRMHMKPHFMWPCQNMSATSKLRWLALIPKPLNWSQFYARPRHWKIILYSSVSWVILWWGLAWWVTHLI